MAAQAFEVLIEAERAFRRADALAAAMEPHLQKLYKNGAIYSYTNKRVVPPGDVLLAAAVAAGISLDDRLGIGREPNETERQMAELRSQVEGLHGCCEQVWMRPARQDSAAVIEAGAIG
jgi:hypothetical protein